MPVRFGMARLHENYCCASIYAMGRVFGIHFTTKSITISEENRLTALKKPPGR